MSRTAFLVAGIVFVLGFFIGSYDLLAAENWAQWRGVRNTGFAENSRPPVSWSEESNIRWKVAIDGSGSSTPIIYGDRVFILTAIDTGIVDPTRAKPEDQPMRVFGIKHPNTEHQFLTICLDRQTGQELWREIAVQKVPHEGHHGDNDFASASPVVHDNKVFVWFGSAGFFCYDLDGLLLWKRDLGEVKMGAALGEGCSPVVHNGRVIVVRDHQGQSSIEALDSSTGKTYWKKHRDEGNAWATPVIAEYGGRVQVITCASNLVRSYNLEDGTLIWQCGGLTGNATPCPILDGSHVIVMSGYQGHSVMRIPITEEGDLTGADKVVWKHQRGTPYVPSPVLFDGMLFYNQSNQGIWTVLDATSGKIVMDRTRLPGISNMYSSPVAANGRIYVTGRNGLTLVLKPGTNLSIESSNRLDERFDASPSIAGDELYLRGEKFLYCIAK
ncbi:MAG: PQQ-like beta-propeller repeat protein [Pirellulales bacterium]|nr:PQQ-like beta-propeller repeat protein [Pirellulales bacterium]